MKSLTNKIAVITGAGSGIGRNLALQLAAKGAIMGLCDVDKNGLNETVEMIKTNGGQASKHIVDVSNRGQMNQFAEQIIATYNAVDILINNAGVTLTPTMFDEITPEQFEWVININLWGVYNGVKAFLPHLRQRPEASIVNISSVAGLIGLMGYTPYVMSKFAVRGLSETLQQELMETNITVTSVHPGSVKTNIIKNAPNYRTEAAREAAHKAVYRVPSLTSEKAAAQIIKAIQKKKNKLVLGPDAKVMHLIGRLFPGSYPKILYPALKRLFDSISGSD